MDSLPKRSDLQHSLKLREAELARMEQIYETAKLEVNILRNALAIQERRFGTNARQCSCCTIQ